MMDEFFLVAQKLQFAAKAHEVSQIKTHMLHTIKYL